MSHLQTKLVSHASRVKWLYKESLRQLQSYYHFRHLYRYEAVLMRARFDANKDERDMIIAKKLLAEGEAELAQQRHPQPMKFPTSPGGVGYGRDIVIPDSVLDMWHPVERSQYPEYFARREQRKQEYIEQWEKKYGKAEESAH